MSSSHNKNSTNNRFKYVKTNLNQTTVTNNANTSSSPSTSTVNNDSASSSCSPAKKPRKENFFSFKASQQQQQQQKINPLTQTHHNETNNKNKYKLVNSLNNSSGPSVAVHNRTTSTTAAAATSSSKYHPSHFSSSNNQFKLRRRNNQSLPKTNFTSSSKFDINVLFNRNVNNLSNNKYKFIKNSRGSGGGHMLNPKKARHWSTYSLNHLKHPFRRRLSSLSLQSSNYYLKIHSSRRRFYRSPMSSTIPVNYDVLRWPTIKRRFLYRNISKNQRKLTNYSKMPNSSNAAEHLRNTKYKLTNSNNILKTNTTSQINVTLANNLIYRSIKTVNKTERFKLKKEQKHSSSSSSSAAAAAATSTSTSKSNYCIFYNRFGRCSRGDSCPMIHDPKRVALCPRFLRGTCKVSDCPYSHDVGPEKVPLCSFFAAGYCNRENCPYSHIYLGKDAEFCLDFARGFCHLGTLVISCNRTRLHKASEDCNKAHIVDCPDYSQNQKCPRGNLCPLVHRNKELTKTNNKNRASKTLKKSDSLKTSSSTSTSTTAAISSNSQVSKFSVDNKDEHETKSLDMSASFIAFQQESTSTNKQLPSSNSSQEEIKPLKIRPVFKPKQ